MRPRSDTTSRSLPSPTAATCATRRTGTFAAEGSPALARRRRPAYAIAMRPAPDPQAPAIEAEGLTKRYGSTVAVDGLSFILPRGGTVGLLGGNVLARRVHGPRAMRWVIVIAMLGALLSLAQGLMQL